MFRRYKHKIATFFLVVFTVSQVFTVAYGLLLPRQAQAVFGIGDITFNTEIASPFKIFQQIAIGALKQMALRIAEKFISRFVNKLVEKYKIRNFLYYDQVLSNYYLSNFLRDKIDDPDLRQIFSLLQAGYITGAPTGTTGGPDPRLALIPRLKRAVTDYYYDHGGIDQDFIRNPQPSISNADYFMTASQFWMSPPSYTQRNLQGRFGEFQSSATTAAQLEVIVGNGLKAGRFVGGTCSSVPEPSVTNGISTIDGIGTITDPNGNPTPTTGTTVGGTAVTNYTEASSPEACAATGGTWTASALDQARSFIDNPTRYIDSYLTSVIQTRIDANFDPNNYWAVIGSLLGNFLFNQLFLDKPTGVLNEDPRGYTPTTVNVTTQVGKEIDLDGDGVPDGFDFTNDGQLDVCTYGGTAPNCMGSQEATSVDPTQGGGGSCAGIASSIDYDGDLRTAETDVNNANPNGIADKLNTEDNSRAYLDEVARVLRSRGFSTSTQVLNGNGNPNNGDLIALWRNGDTMAERFDAIVSVGAGDRPLRDAATVNYVNDVPFDPCIP